MFEKGFLSKAYAPKEQGDNNNKRKEVPKKTPVFDAAKNAEKNKKHEGDEANLSQEKAQQSDVGTLPLPFKPGFLDKKPKETQNEVSGKQKSHDITKDTDKSSKEVETKSSRSEGGPQYLTDKGSPIPIGKDSEPHFSPEQMTQKDREIQHWLNGELISGYDRSYNCHSYVFTDGKAGWIGNPDTVEMIIKDNGFQRIASASYDNTNHICKKLSKKGDIIIYRDKNKEAVHSGIIFHPDEDPDRIFVDSKMGRSGIFRCRLTSICTSSLFEGITHWEIYHTDRPRGRLITEIKNEGDH